MNSKIVKNNLIITLQKKKNTEYVVYINHKKIKFLETEPEGSYNEGGWAKYEIVGIFKNKIKLTVPITLLSEGCEIKVYPLVNGFNFGDPYVGYYKEETKK